MPWIAICGMVRHDVVIKNAKTLEYKDLVDIAIQDGQIEQIGSVSADSDTVIDTKGNFVSPGLVDAHKHIDRALAAVGDDTPAGNNGAFDWQRSVSNEREYYSKISIDELASKSVQNLQMAVSHGSTYVRSHLCVDDDIFGLDNVQAAVEARKRTVDLVDLQLVPGWQSDSIDSGWSTMEEAISIAKSDDIHNSVLLGGSDPASKFGDLEGTIKKWFSTASNHGIGIDVHINEPGMLGSFTLQRLMDYIEKYEYPGDVTATHAYGLAQMPEWRATELIERAADVGLGIITCYNSARPGMPMQSLLTQQGLSFAHGTDNDRDFVLPYGNADQIEAQLMLVNKLHGKPQWKDPESDYRWLESNLGLEKLWSMVTYGGAEVLGIKDEYGLEENNPANIAIFDSQSPQWAIINNEPPTYVLKDGQVVAEGGELLPEARIE
jgi:cytosine/adenosine deaminase-related metal-dependent hydrolase